MLWCKVVLISATVFVFSQASDWQKSQDQDDKIGSRELVEIDDASYFIDTVKTFNRHEAKLLCKWVNMTLVRFDSDEKWRSVNRWLNENGYEHYYFWSDAIRDEGSTEWYWETTGSVLTDIDLYWGAGKPHMPPPTVRSCLSFCYSLGGFDDDDCSQYRLNALCQK